MTELRRGWAWATLADCCTVTLGQSPPGDSYNDRGIGTPFFQGKAEFGSLRPTVKKWTTQPTKTAAEDDVLVSVRAPVGPTNLAPFDCAIGRGLGALRPLGGIDSRYVLYWLRASERELTARGTGTTFGAISGAVLREHPVPLAPLAEQRRIVAAIEEHLSRLDAAVELMRRTAARLDALRGAVIDAAFAEDWPRALLGEVAEVVGGVTKDSKRQQAPGLVEIPYLRVANVQRGFLDLETVTTIRVPPETAAKLELRPGDVLFNEGGDRDKLGRGWVWSGEIPNCIHQNHVFRARLRDGFDPRFLSWWGNSFGREWFWRHGRQTTNLASMSLSTLKAFPVPAPPLDEQRAAVGEIERSLSTVDHLAQVVGASRDRADALRRSILARAFRGELVPQDTSDEPATALLERIAAERAASPVPARKRRVRTMA